MKLIDAEIEGTRTDGRSSWTFPYRANAISRAAAKQAAFHRERETHYIGEAERLEATLREKGIELREQQVTGGAQFSAVVDPDLARQLGEARNRRDGHNRSARLFEAYVGAFNETGDLVRHLTIADIDYFALHREPGE